MKKLVLFSILLAVLLAFTACPSPTGGGGGGGGGSIPASAVAVSGVSLKASIGLVIGGTETLSATITPSNATNKKVTWGSSNDTVAVVSAGSIVTGVGEGTAIITVTTADGGYKADCTVTVSYSLISVTGVSLKPATSLVTGGTETLFAIIEPANATDKDVSWASSNDSVARVSGNGLVTAVAAGTATVTVTTADGGHQASCAVTVSDTVISVTGVSLNKLSASLFTGDTEILTAIITPSNATNQNITWNSSNDTIAAVSAGGVVFAKNAGTATITVTTSDSNKTATCNVTVAGSTSVRKVFFSGPTETVTFSGLINKDIYLVKVNTSYNYVSAANTGGPSGSSPVITSRNVLPNEAPLPRMGHPAAENYHANPPPYIRKPARRSGGHLISSLSYTVGFIKEFWVETAHGNMEINWEQKSATLVKQGKYGNIWVVDSIINSTQAQALSDKFDAIYPVETSLLGYEYGGGLTPGNTEYGGWDNDTRIQILVYDIGYDPAGTTLGYFWAKDMRIDIGSGYRSNEAEMFYLNGNPSVYTIFGADNLYSALVHEFQHMINYSQKYIKNGVSSETWYNEMLSMLAQDVISPLIGIDPTNSGHPIKSRIPRFLSVYNGLGISVWDSNTQLSSYSMAYAYGAYLLRNYDGASLLKEMLANNSTNINSVTAALKTVGGSGLSFEESLRRFGEAIVFSEPMPSDVLSFDKTVTQTIGGTSYTATRFNVWNDFGTTTKPRVFGSTEQVEMQPYSITVHQDSSWKGRTGTFSVILNRPANSSIEFYLMVK
ncbi:MAG: Ig-like domain-containing protein [Treponema sp.]|jgi:uncharacterized protein YjdB|nr:Ig-like domain-containing protein [Treponema sp.]